jgi:hypothetical protein
MPRTNVQMHDKTVRAASHFRYGSSGNSGSLTDGPLASAPEWGLEMHWTATPLEPGRKLIAERREEIDEAAGLRE